MSYDISQNEIFHGTSKEIRVFEIRLDMNLLPCDFGNGFYTTPSYMEAVDWALIKNPRILIVNIYELDLQALAKLNVANYDESVNWYKAVRDNRRTNEPQHATDIVIAPVATALDIEMMKHDMDDEAIEKYLHDAPQERDIQIVFLTTRAVEDCLTFKGADRIRRGDDNE